MAMILRTRIILSSRGSDRSTSYRSLSKDLQVELQNGKIISYYVEWCNMSKTPQRGLACLDTTLLYKDDEHPDRAHIEFVDERSPQQNIYIGVPIKVAKLGDPVLNQHVQRGRRLLQQTSWANSAGLRMHQASLALAT